MLKKLTYKYIKKCFEDRGYTLLSRKYVSSRDLLWYLCPEMHMGCITFNNFQRGHGCRFRRSKVKLTYEYVKEYFEKYGYTLISTEYINCMEKLEYLCPKGHLAAMKFNSFQQGKRCPKCAGNMKKTIEEVKGIFESRKYELLSTEYKNVSTKLKVSCPEGHETFIVLDSFNNGHGCAICAGNAKPTIQYVKEYFEKEGYTLLSTKYVNSRSKLKYRCPEGHEGTINFMCFKQGIRCPKCSSNAKKSLGHIQKEFGKEGYALLSTEYKNAHVKLEYICPEGHLGSMCYNNFQQGYRCPLCYSGRVSKISQVWLDSLNIPGLEREYSIRIGKRSFSVDGYDPLTNTIYEFLGNYWHGNPEMYNANGINPSCGKTYGQLYKETFERLVALEANGYNVTYIWESDFKKG
jgi:hypothetical protein